MYITIQDYEILDTIAAHDMDNQRRLAKRSGYSLGGVNRSVQSLKAEGYLDGAGKLTERAWEEYSRKKPKNAIILAAGYGMRMVPINTEYPKAMLEVRGERLIERLIRQLREAEITEIHVVVGFMKEKFEYLIDQYHVHLIVNTDYSTKNNLHSLHLAADYLSNSYIIPSDLYFVENPFRVRESHSWYMVSDRIEETGEVYVSRTGELHRTDSSHRTGNAMVGIAYLTENDASVVRASLQELDAGRQMDGAFWETTLYRRSGKKEKMCIAARVFPDEKYYEINTYEQLREVDSNSRFLKSDAIDIICDALEAQKNDVKDITVLKKGMTNRSFLFSYQGQKYIMRIPGEGTDQLISRSNEAAVYQQIRDIGICDDLVYINPENGYKITKYLDRARVCDAADEMDLSKCMHVLRGFHQRRLQVDHEFNLYERIEFYESLWNGQPSVFDDYLTTKQNTYALKAYVEKHTDTRCLTHIDAVPDNFLFAQNANGEEEIRLIDWEYAGMQDPHVDLAMFCIYAYFNREQTDHLIDLYFDGKCEIHTRIKIYAYMAISGLLWSNWCEYKRNIGVEFGEYSLLQYRYAKEFYRLVVSELGKLGETL